MEVFSKHAGARTTGNPANTLGNTPPLAGDPYAGFVAYKNDRRCNPRRVTHRHTDNTGNADKNLQLSKDRAASVKAYPVSKGVDTARMRSEGLGQERPAYENSASEGRAKNRRVELTVAFFDEAKS